ncbi:cobalt ABC transporter ATP-binding protein [Anaerosporomusa subterranea]|uniref:Cobalt ABC transporter ATP-binding protein n=1 Tax=Anaerosporomusa subterranea TaxID=1794912 RepID=A0A154BWF5_ANASB|nr:ABC transporter ATP-binding protein [Anaerosporomusa subterranea]KYZ78120.1 cobalt ABC transporter ATP-binding protein [Anaerosporomusa subterranea]
MSHHIVESITVEYAYPDKTEALRGISLRITHGESVAIVGANGAGKSTLLSLLAGVTLPTRGTVRIGDYPVNRQTIAQIRRCVGMVFQNPDDQLFMPTVYDDVAFGPLNLGFPSSEVDTRVANALATVGAADLAERPPYKLSGGQKRAVAIATVLSMIPDILVMDEPSAGLDPRARRKLIELLASFSHTKIVATHDLDLALDVCERTILLSEGKVVADGLTQVLFKDQGLLEQYGLELPLRLQDCPLCSQGR